MRKSHKARAYAVSDAWDKNLNDLENHAVGTVGLAILATAGLLVDICQKELYCRRFFVL